MTSNSAVALQREYPELLGTRRLTACPHDQPEPPRGTLAAFTLGGIRRW